MKGRINSSGGSGGGVDGVGGVGIRRGGAV